MPAPSLHSAHWWHTLDDGRIHCDLCPRGCNVADGQRAMCFVRQNVGGEMVLTTYGKSTGFCIDPIEKKPFNHFLPGSSVLSFGTAGCNLACKFCQNWTISKSRETEILSDDATPEQIAAAAKKHNCRSVAFTYNDPVIWAEYAIDTIRACRDAGVKSTAVTAGYINDAPRREFLGALDACKVDLKAFTERFYRKVTFSHLQPVLDTLKYLVNETAVWTEIVTLVIPGENDSEDEAGAQASWIRENLGPDVPLHFTAFHPDFRMMDKPNTPPSTLARARAAARREGLRYVYTGNVHDRDGDTTFCPACNAPAIVRDWYRLLEWNLRADATGHGACGSCGTAIPGFYEAAPGTWGAKRQPVRIGA